MEKVKRSDRDVMEKVKRSDRDVSTVVLRVFLSQTFPSILSTNTTHPADSCNFGVIEKLTSACYFQIAIEIIILLILKCSVLSLSHYSFFVKSSVYSTCLMKSKFFYTY